ncbi:UNVERIFIED_CONTAM: hypothetical protein FKN15_030945 [Acipenser sinensis]
MCLTFSHILHFSLSSQLDTPLQAALCLEDVLGDLVDSVNLQEQGLEAVQGSFGPLSGHNRVETVCLAEGGGVGGDA